MKRAQNKWARMLAVVLILGVMGCGHNTGNTPNEQEASFTMAQPGIRMDFDDIMLPPDLTLDSDRSFVFETGDFKAGTLYLSGYVNVDSLKAYFTDQMPKDGWRLRSVFRFPKLVLVYEKINKICIIEVYEGTVYTQVEIWVAPTV